MKSSRNGARFWETLHFISNLPPPQKLEEERELDPQLAFLRRWQSERLAYTHADLLASPRYGPACRFFLTDIYAPRDFSQRDHEIEHLYTLMSHFLPHFLLSLASDVIEMNNLAHRLDQALLRALVDELGMTDTITPEMYSQAYRICDNYTERAAQIELLVHIGRKVEIGTHMPLVGTTLRLARTPARRAGWHALQDFLERGFKAFKHMGKADVFLKTIRQRELMVLERIFAAEADPFSLP